MRPATSTLPALESRARGVRRRLRQGSPAGVRTIPGRAQPPVRRCRPDQPSTVSSSRAPGRRAPFPTSTRSGAHFLGPDRRVAQRQLLDLRGGPPALAGARAPVRGREAQSAERRNPRPRSMRGMRSRCSRPAASRTSRIPSSPPCAWTPPTPWSRGQHDRAQPRLVYGCVEREPGGERRPG